MVSLQVILAVVTAALMVGFSASDLAQDRDQCTDQLVSLSPCLTYVSGDAKSPTRDCCMGLGQVLRTGFKCLCVMVKDRDEAGRLGLKVNTTLALGLPSTCHAPVNISRCIEMLQLNPTSPDAKIYSEFESTLEKSNRTLQSYGNSSQTSQTVANIMNDGLRKKASPATKLIVGIVVCWTIISSSFCR